MLVLLLMMKMFFFSEEHALIIGPSDEISDDLSYTSDNESISTAPSHAHDNLLPGQVPQISPSRSMIPILSHLKTVIPNMNRHLLIPSP